MTEARDPVWCWLGRVPFAPVAALQERLRADLLAGHGPETLLLLEHTPVITLGRSAQPSNVHLPGPELARRGIDLVETSRGGDVTYHGPGQLVGYPIVRLRAGVVGHMSAIARAVAGVLAELGIDARWRRDAPGLWVGDAKICAVGVHVRRRVAIHGFALNVAADLAGFDLIVPCGITGVKTTSIELQGMAAPPMEDLATRVAARLGAEIDVPFVRQPAQVNCNVEPDH